jgi:hypothetical protein
LQGEPARNWVGVDTPDLLGLNQPFFLRICFLDYEFLGPDSK